MASVSRVPGNAAAIALIVLPVIALVLRFILPGWMMLILFVASPALVIAYALAVVIAITGFLSGRAAFAVARTSWRGVTAALAASVGVLLASFFMVDGGDTGAWGSPFTLLLGQENPSGLLGDLTGFASVIFGLLAVGAFVWLVIEWIIALVQRRKRSTPISI